MDDLSLQVRCGETVGLLGPNGAGKTTVVRVLTTLTPVQSGEVYIFGLDSRRHTMDIRHNIGYVPQQLSIEVALTGRQNVELFARLYDVPAPQRADRVDEALDAMQLLDVADAAGGHLLRRHGPPARVGAGAGQPAVAADPRRADRRAGSHCPRQRLGTGADTCRREFGMTVLLTTHYMEEADALCDRVALMHHGRLRAVGTPAELEAAGVAPGRDARGCFPALRRLGSGRGHVADAASVQIRYSRRTARRVS